MKKVVLVVLVAVLVAVGFAYAAANSVPVTGAVTIRAWGPAPDPVPPVPGQIRPCATRNR